MCLTGCLPVYASAAEAYHPLSDVQEAAPGRTGWLFMQQMWAQAHASSVIVLSLCYAGKRQSRRHLRLPL